MPPRGVRLGGRHRRSIRGTLRGVAGWSQDPSLMQPLVFTGAPGTGKTTLLHALAAQGYRIVHESARELIRGRVEKGLAPRPAPADFARQLLQKDAEKYETAASESGLVFFDRGVV